MERAISPDTTTLPRQENEEKEENKTRTPDIEIRQAVSTGRSNVVTRSAKKNDSRDATSGVVSNTRQLRPSGRSAECEQIPEDLDKPLLQEQEHDMAASDDLAKTEVKKEAPAGAEIEVENKVRHNANDACEGKGRYTEENEDLLKNKQFLCSPKKNSNQNKQFLCSTEEYKENDFAGLGQGDEAYTHKVQSDTEVEYSITKPRPDNLADVDRNMESKDAKNDVPYNEHVTDYEANETEEERKRRIRLSQILESSSMTQANEEISEMKTVTDNNIKLLKGAVDGINNGSSMIAGDAQEGYTKDYLTQNNEITGRDHEILDSQVGLTTAGNLEAGGDAGAAPQTQQSLGKAQTFREPTPECVQANQNVKREPAEKISKGTSILKGELAYEVDSSLIPIKPIPALNAVPSQENDTTLDSINTVPYIPPDANMLYQPESGIMKSKPVPKPTRGRRGRRRSPNLVTPLTGYRQFMHHPNMHVPEEARLVPRHPYHQRYRPPEFHPGDYCEVMPSPDGDYVAYHGEDGGEMVSGGDISNLPAISPGYPVNRWYYGDDYYKMSRPLYIPRGRGRGSSGGRGRPRGQRGSGGVRQYLQHRLLWARYTGRSQEALDRVLSIINSKCGLQEDGSKEPTGSRAWTAAGREGAVEGGMPPEQGDYTARLDRGMERSACRSDPGHSDPDPYSVYDPGTFSSNISNMMTAGGSSSASILSQGGIGSNAVVDGNGYIVYLNQEDSTDYQQHLPVPFVPSETNLGGGGDSDATLERPVVRSGDIIAENDVRRSEEMTLPQETCVRAENSTIVPNKLVIDSIPTVGNIAEMGTTAETSAMARIPHESSQTPSRQDECYNEQGNSKLTSGRKRTTPKVLSTAGLKTPVSPMKEPKGSKRQGQNSGGRQKKKVRRSLTFSSPIKQDETLMATENIANALTNSGSSESESAAGSTCSTTDYLHPSSSNLPSISNLLHSSNNAGISINIHVTNDTNNKERSVSHTNEDVLAGRMLQNTLEQTNKGTVRADLVTRPGEANPQLHYSVPRYTVEWHGDYHYPDPEEVPVMDRPSHRYQEHAMPVPPVHNTTASRFRYPYRDPSTIHGHGYYSQQRPFPTPSSPLDRYFTADYAKEWSGVYTKYPPEHYPSSYEAQHPAVSTAYSTAQWSSGWSRNADMFMDPYQKPSSSRPILEPEMRDIPYSLYHKATAPYPRVQPGYPEELYSQHPPPYGNYGVPSAMVSHQHAKERLVATVPDVMQEARQPENEYESHRLHQSWAMTSCTQGPHVLQEGSVGDSGPGAHSPQLQPPVRCGVLEPDHQENCEHSSQLPEGQAQM